MAKSPESLHLTDDEIRLRAWKQSPRHAPVARFHEGQLDAAADRRVALSRQLDRKDFSTPDYIRAELSEAFMRVQMELARALMKAWADIESTGFTDIDVQSLLTSPQIGAVINHLSTEDRIKFETLLRGPEETPMPALTGAAE